MSAEQLLDKDTSFFLHGTGWDLAGHMRMITQTSAEASSVLEWRQLIQEKTQSDLLGLYWEYMIKSPILPFKLSLSNDGSIVCPEYGNKPLPEIVSENERAGTIKRSMEKLSANLSEALDGDTFLLISPPGWSGYEGISYPDTQIYYYQKMGSEIRSMTFLSPGASLEHCDMLREKLTGEKHMNTDNKKRILSHTASIISARYLEPHDIAYCLEQILQTPQTKLYEVIENLPNVDLKVQQCLNELSTYIEQHVWDYSETTQTALMYKIGQTVLDMKSVLTRGRKPVSSKEYAQSFVEFSQDEGCNGGGTIYGREGAKSEEEEFPNEGICRLYDSDPRKNACISKSPGQKESLGLCMICKGCDRAFKVGKTLEQIKSLSMESKTDAKPIEAPSGSIFAVAAYLFVDALFKN